MIYKLIRNHFILISNLKILAVELQFFFPLFANLYTKELAGTAFLLVLPKFQVLKTGTFYQFS